MAQDKNLLKKALIGNKIAIWFGVVLYLFLFWLHFKFFGAWIPAELRTPETKGLISFLHWFLLGYNGFFLVVQLLLLNNARNSKMYYAHLINLVLTCATCIGIPFAISPLLKWFSPEVKEYFFVIPPPAPPSMQP